MCTLAQCTKYEHTADIATCKHNAGAKNARMLATNSATHVRHSADAGILACWNVPLGHQLLKVCMRRSAQRRVAPVRYRDAAAIKQEETQIQRKLEQIANGVLPPPG